MKLLFVENRYATWVYESVAHELARAGHEIHWLVQNPMFAPSWGRVHKMPFPPAAARATAALTDDYAWLRRTDRGVLHFGTSGDHYAHYDQHISATLDAVQPDAIFGEATEFHELLTAARARQRRMAYLSPNVTRYPADRLAFMAYDSLDPVGGDGSLLPDAAADAMLAGIRDRQVVPSYMRPVAPPARSMALVRLKDKLRVTAGWLAGERFITPSPARKLSLNAVQRQQRQRWEDRAGRQPSAFAKLLSRQQPWVLYALQMQPEGNIDVWGSPWNDQTDIVRRAARALAAEGAVLVVKPNPKSKYEMTAALNDVLDSEPNVIGLAHPTPMRDVFPAAPLVLVVTGTVLLEAIIAGKPVASLGSHSMRRYAGVTPLQTPEHLPAVLAAATQGRADTASALQARALLQSLHAASYPATLWDPVTQPDAADAGVVPPLVQAFQHVLAQLASGACVWPETEPAA